MFSTFSIFGTDQQSDAFGDCEVDALSAAIVAAEGAIDSEGLKRATGDVGLWFACETADGDEVRISQIAHNPSICFSGKEITQIDFL